MDQSIYYKISGTCRSDFARRGAPISCVIDQILQLQENFFKEKHTSILQLGGPQLGGVGGSVLACSGAMGAAEGPGTRASSRRFSTGDTSVPPFSGRRAAAAPGSALPQAPFAGGRAAPPHPGQAPPPALPLFSNGSQHGPRKSQGPFCPASLSRAGPPWQPDHTPLDGPYPAVSAAGTAVSLEWLWLAHLLSLAGDSLSGDRYNAMSSCDLPMLGPWRRLSRSLLLVVGDLVLPGNFSKGK